MAERLNLDNLVGSTIHSHNYIKVDGSEASNAKYVKQYERDKGIYSSPRNIRKLYIKSTGIDIVYYRPIVGGGDNLSETIGYSNENKTLLKKICYNFINEYMGRECESSINVQGTGFASFKNDLSVSNLEELYFDWTLLLGNKELFSVFADLLKLKRPVMGLANIGYEFYADVNSANTVKMKRLQANTMNSSVWNNIPGSKEALNILIPYLTKEMCGDKRGGLATNFPRLKYIGFIGNSNLVLKSKGKVSKEVIKNYEFEAFYNQYSIEEIQKGIFSNGELFKFCLFYDTGVDLINTGFRVDTGLYQFDADFLYDFFKNTTCAPNMTREAELTKWFVAGTETRLGLESKLWWVNQLRTGQLAGQKAAKKSLATIDDRIDKNAVEKELTEEEKQKELDNRPRTESEVIYNATLSSDGLDGLQDMLKILMGLYTREGVQSEINKFSPVGREYYSKILAETPEINFGAGRG